MTFIKAKKRGCGNNFRSGENLNKINEYHRKSIEPFCGALFTYIIFDFI